MTVFKLRRQLRSDVDFYSSTERHEFHRFRRANRQSLWSCERATVQIEPFLSLDSFEPFAQSALPTGKINRKRSKEIVYFKQTTSVHGI